MPRPVDTGLAAGEGLRLDLGIHDNEKRLRNLEAQLRTLGFATQREPLQTAAGGTGQRLLVVSLRDDAAAQRAIRDIARKMGVAAKLDSTASSTVGVR
jgi:type VI secretion system protein ImpL